MDMETPNTFKLIDEVEWIGREVLRVRGCLAEKDYEALPTLFASIRRSLVCIETMIEEKGNV